MHRLVVTLLLSLVSGQATAASISTFGANFAYGWEVDAVAEISGTRFFESNADSTPSSPTRQFAGEVVSPVPAQTYDTSPVSFQQPDGSFAPMVTFNESWIGAEAEGRVQVEPGSDGSSVNTRLFSASRADAFHATDTWRLGVGDAFASSEMRFSSFFTVSPVSGESGAFDLHADFFDSIAAGVLASQPVANAWSQIDVGARIRLRNQSTGDVLLEQQVNYGPFRESLPFQATFNDLSFGDTYWFEIFLATSALASSSVDILYTDPGCDPSVSTCFIEGFRYDDVSSSALATIDFELAVETTVVPVPAAFWMFATALAGLAGMRGVGRRGSRKSVSTDFSIPSTQALIK